MSDIPKCPVCDGPAEVQDNPNRSVACFDKSCVMFCVWMPTPSWRALPRRCEGVEKLVEAMSHAAKKLQEANCGSSREYADKCQATFNDARAAVLACMVVPPSGAGDKGDLAPDTCLCASFHFVGNTVEMTMADGSVHARGRCEVGGQVLYASSHQAESEDVAKSPVAPLPPVPPLTPEDADNLIDSVIAARQGMRRAFHMEDDESLAEWTKQYNEKRAALRARILPTGGAK